jgi:hypothetical protein
MISASSFIQWAGCGPDQGPKDVAKMIKTYDKRRQYMLRRLLN